MERDPKSGRFLPGNQTAVGNRGNRKPKWGNKNAKKHGLFSTFVFPRILDDGRLLLYKKGYDPIVISPEGFIIDDGYLCIRTDILEELEEYGFVPDF
jgi:hypothetical protein